MRLRKPLTSTRMIRALRFGRGSHAVDQLTSMIQDGLPRVPQVVWIVEWPGAVRWWTRTLWRWYPQRSLLPIAKAAGSDDIVCVDLSDPSGRIVEIHAFASPGWEFRGSWLNLTA